MGCCCTKHYPTYDEAQKLELTGNFKARLVDIYDGDTQTYVIEFNKRFYRISVRVNGIDTPEIKAKDLQSRERAIQARNRAFEILTGQNPKNPSKQDLKRMLNERTYMVTLRCYKNEKYGRTLADVVSYKGVDLGKQLISEGLAVYYDGGSKSP